VERDDKVKPEAARLPEEALMRGEFERGEIPRITGLPERPARRVFNDVTEAGLLASVTPKGPVSPRVLAGTVDILFPRLFAEI
jgi:Fic family protein